MSNQIEYTIKIDNDLHVIHVQVHGRLDFSNTQELSIKVREMASKYNYGIFYDMRDVSLDGDTLDIYRFPRENKAFEDLGHRHIRAALLISKGERVDDWKFYETTSSNCGLLIRVFVEDEKNALEWALGK